MATEKLRAVLDTNVPIAAYLSKNPRSPTKELIDRWRNEEFVQLYSDGTLAELKQKFAEKGIDSLLVERYIADLLRIGVHVEVSLEDIRPVIPDDPDDDLIVACAVVGEATHIVTYDPHFEVLGGEYKGIKVLDGLGFLRLVRGDEPPEGS